MDLTDYRMHVDEVRRTNDLLDLMPVGGKCALDAGARDGHFSVLMAQRFSRVTALDLSKPDIQHPNVETLKGDITNLNFEDGSYDFVFCAEVLEHIPTSLLANACRELERVSRWQILIGVPYKQDIRVGRTTCSACGMGNPPWGHVNSFDDKKIESLFPACKVIKKSFVGTNSETTNFLAAALFDMAGNPYGTYEQNEECIHCGKQIIRPANRSQLQKISTKAGFICRNFSERFAQPHPNWIHLLLEKSGV